MMSIAMDFCHMRLNRLILIFSSFALCSGILSSSRADEIAGGVNSLDVGHATSTSDFQRYSIRHYIRRAATSAPLGSFDKRESKSDKPVDNGKFSCKVTVSPSGSIVALIVADSSGSPELDKRALDLIKSVAPFKAFHITGDHSYLVEFPNLEVNSVKD